MSGQTVTDEELVAYLDHEMPAARQHEIEAALAADDALQGRLDGLILDDGALRGAFDAMLDGAPPPPSALARGATVHRPVFAARHSARGGIANPWMRAAAMLALGVGLGYGASRFPQSGHDGWREAVADYQSLYTAETLRFAPSDGPSQQEQVGFAAARLGRPITRPAIEVAGFTFRRAQVLDYRGRPLVQFAYAGPNGVPVALCAIRTGAPDQPIQDGVIHGQDEVSWSKDGFGYMVVGNLPAATLRQIAEAVAPRV